MGYPKYPYIDKSYNHDARTKIQCVMFKLNTIQRAGCLMSVLELIKGIYRPRLYLISTIEIFHL